MTRKYSSLELSAPKAENETYIKVTCQMVQLLLMTYAAIKSMRTFQRIDYDRWMVFIQNHVRSNPDSGLIIRLKPDGVWMATTTDGTVTGNMHHCEQELPQGRSRKISAGTAVNIVSLLRRMFERRSTKNYYASRADRLKSPLGVDQIFTEMPIFDIDECFRELLQQREKTIVIAVYEGEVHFYDEAEPEAGHVFKFAHYNPALAASLPVF